MSRSTLSNALNLVFVLSFFVLFTNCSTREDDMPNDIPKDDTKRDLILSDFEMKIIQITNNQGAGYVKIMYNVQNNYIVNYDGKAAKTFAVKFTVKDTEGTVYEVLENINYSKAGDTQALFLKYLPYDSKKTVDMSTFSGTIINTP